MSNPLREAINEKDVLFQRLFTSYQAEIKKNKTKYLQYDAFRDLKIILELYAETFHLKGFNYNSLKVADIKKIISDFDDYQKKELVEYLIKSLTKNGIDGKAKELLTLLSQLEIKCAWHSLVGGKKIILNLFKLFHNLSAYNIYTLIGSAFLYLILLMLIFTNAPFTLFEILEIKPALISQNYYINLFLNVLLYIFDIEGKMEVKPLNFSGVLLLVCIKSILILIVVNFFLKQFIERVKVS